MLLLTLEAIIFIMNIGLLFLYGDSFSFELLQFVQPYLIIAVPTMVCISVLALIFDMIFGKYTIIQNAVFFFLFSAMILYNPKKKLTQTLEVFGSKLVIDVLIEFGCCSPSWSCATVADRFCSIYEYKNTIRYCFRRIFIVFIAAILGLLTKGKKLFEILFFLLTYANLNKVPFLDYFGGFHQNNLFNINLICIVAILLRLTFFFRKWQLAKD